MNSENGGENGRPLIEMKNITLDYGSVKALSDVSVDFDSGEGYYCWRYPEAAVQHYHGYEDGFAGRMKIV